MSGMNCREFGYALMESARSGLFSAADRAGLEAHLEICEGCRVAHERQIRLSATSRALAAEAAQFAAPPGVEQALLRELECNGKRQRRRWAYSVAGCAVAAALAMTVWTNRKPAPRMVSASAATVPVAAQPVVAAVAERVPVKRHKKRAVHAAAAPEQPFIAIPYTLPLEPYERADVMRVDMPVAALVAAGLPMGMTDPGANAQADVLVGQDGRARAVRLISISSLNESGAWK